MDVNQCYEVMKYAVAKNIQQGYLSPHDFYTVINQAQRSYLDYLLGEYQQYKQNRPVSVVVFGGNERIRDSIAPLIYGRVLTVAPTTGIAGFPSDYEYVDNMWGLYGNYNIRFIQQDRLDSFVHSQIDPVINNPVYLIQHEGFHFYPEDIGQARLSYVRTPPSIVWGYTLDSNNNPVWNASASQNPVWSDTDMLQIMVRALQIVGVNLQFNTLLGYASEVKNVGQ